MDDDLYDQSLHEIFMTCDRDGDGYIVKEELINLCHRLQLAELAPQIVDVLIPRGSSGHISFEEFRNGFMHVLSRVTSATETDTSESDSESQATRHLSTRGKRYGRRSRPDSEVDTSYSDNDFDSFSDSRKSTSPAPSTAANAQWNMSPGSTRIDAIEPLSYNSDDEVAAAEEKERLKAILQEVNVGQAGFLDVHELKTVCEHIGMENLNEEDLSFLFEELDENKDGTLSFDEFLHGLSIVKELGTFANSPPLSLPETPPQTLRVPSLKRRTSVTRLGIDDLTAQTSRVPTPYSFNQTADLFSSLDPNHTGCVPAEAVSDILLQEGLTNAHEIIQNIDIDTDGKINIRQLSEDLEQIIIATSQDTNVAQAILSVYKSEIGFLRSTIDEYAAEKDRLKADQVRSNDERAMLIRESEERSIEMERSHKSMIKNAEREYQSKIQTLHKEMEVEREKWNQQHAKQIQKLENAIGQQRHEEQNLKDKLADAEEIKHRLEEDLTQTQSRLHDAQRNLMRKSKELESASEYSTKMAEYEAHREDLSKQQSTYVQQERRELEQQNRELRDQVDELTTRCEKFQDQVSQMNNAFNRRGGPRGPGGGRGVGRVGSVLSDYAKPLIVKRRGDGESDSDSDTSEETSSGAESDVLKKLKKEREPSASERQVEALKVELEEWKEKYNGIKAAFTKEKIELLEKHDRETAQMNEKYNSDLAELHKLADNDRNRTNDKMQQYQMHIEELNQHINDLNVKIEELENEIAALKKERDDIKLNHEGELLNIGEAFDLERQNLEREFDNRKNKIIEVYAEEKENMQMRFQKEKNDLDAGYLEEKMQLEEVFIAQKLELEEEKDKERDEIVTRYEQERREMENLFAQDKNKLKELIESEYREVLEQKIRELTDSFNSERSVLANSMSQDAKKIREEFEILFEKKREDLEIQHNDDMKELSKVFSEEKTKLDDEYRRQQEAWEREKLQLENKLKNLEEKFKLEQEKNLSSEKSKHQKNLIDSLSREKEKNDLLMKELESTYQADMDKLNNKHAKEMNQLRKQMQSEANKEIQRLTKQFETESESSEKSSISLLNRQIMELQHVVDKLKEDNAKLISEKNRLEEEYKKDNANVLQAMNIEMESLINQYNEAQNELNHIKQSNMELENNVTLLKEKLALVGNGSEDGTKKLQAKIEEHLKEKSSWENSMREIKERNILLMTNIDSLEATITEMEKSKGDAIQNEKSRNSDLQSEVEILVVKFREKEAEVKIEKKKATEAESTAQNLKIKMAEITAQTEAFKKTLMERESSMQQISSSQESMHNEINALRNKLRTVETDHKEAIETKQQVLIELNNEKQLHRMNVTQLAEKFQQKEKEDKLQLDALQQELTLLRNNLLEKENVYLDLKKEMETFASDGYIQRQEYQREIEKYLLEKNSILREKEDLYMKLKETRDAMENHISVMRAQIAEAESRAERNNVLVSELYLENCVLSKQMCSIEQGRKKVEKDYKNISAQKLKLQNLLNSLCKATI